jgi:hypothetical protein
VRAKLRRPFAGVACVGWQRHGWHAQVRRRLSAGLSACCCSWSRWSRPAPRPRSASGSVRGCGGRSGTRRGAAPGQVRQTPSWPRSWANFSLLWLYSHWNVWANLHIWANLAPFSLGRRGPVGPRGARAALPGRQAARPADRRARPRRRVGSVRTASPRCYADHGRVC